MRRIAADVNLILLALAICSASNMAKAEPVTFFGIDDSKVDMPNASAARSQMLSLLSTYAVESMEGLTGPDPTLFASTPFETVEIDFDQVYSFFPTSVSGTKSLLDKGPSTPTGPIQDDWIQFPQPITAFGSYFVQAGDGLANTITFRLEDTTLGTPSRDVILGPLGPEAPTYSVFFFGLIDTVPFDRVTMIESHDYDGILLDDMVAGFATVPEPCTLSLTGSGLVVVAMMAALRRRRRRRHAAP